MIVSHDLIGACWSAAAWQGAIRYDFDGATAPGEGEKRYTGARGDAHGFRSLLRDWASENGYARDLVEQALAHTVANKVEAAYHRTDLLDQRRPMMEAWAAYVLGATD